jgi:parallel beta-helix repeat protein
MFFLLVTSVLTLVFNIQPVRAQGTIYIRADGNIDPPDAPISSLDNVTYTVTGNITDSIVVERDNIVVNGAGYNMTGSRSGNGITLTDRTNVTVEKIMIQHFDYGIWLSHSSDNVLFSNNVIANQWGGIFLDFSSSNNTLFDNNVAGSDNGVYLSNSSKNTLFGNNITYNGDGITLHSNSSDNRLSGNNVTANRWSGIVLDSSNNNVLTDNNALDNAYMVNVGCGISLWASSNNTLSGNVMEGNRYDFDVDGYALSHYLHSIDASNLVNGKSVHYLMNQSDIVISADAYPEVGYLGLVNCANITVQGLNLTSNGQGVLVAFTNGSRITGNNVADNAYGIVLGSSFNNILSGNNVTSSQMFGIVLGSPQGYPDFSSNSNIFSGNNIADTHYYHGISLISSSNNTFVGNNVTASFQDGIRLMYSSNNNTLFRNNVTANNGCGVRLIYSSNNNTLSGNNVAANNEAGIYLDGSSDNMFYHNNFVDNAQHAISGSSVNVWDDGYPSGGNYWSDYKGTDADHDGIGDTEYSIDINNIDHYPLMGMFNSYNVTYYTPPIMPHACNVTVISNSRISDFVAPIWIEHPEVIFLQFNVSGAEGSNGFCRVSFPTAMMNGTYHVSVNGTEIPYTLLPFSDANYSYLYFNYTHSTQEVIIIPEFPSFLILPLFFIGTLLAVIVYRRNRR